MLSRAFDLVRALTVLAGARRSEERGQTLVEYGLLLFFIAIVVIVVLMLLGPTVSAIFQSVNDNL